MKPASVLVVEDDEIVARTIERSLRGQDIQVNLANSGVEGLKAARRLLPDLAILDVVMPGMDGYTLCREIRADPLLCNLPVLFLTAKIKDEDKITGFKAGADDYLSKPFNIDELIFRVRALLRRSQGPKAPPIIEEPEETFTTSLSSGVQSIIQQISQDNKAVAADHCLIVGSYVLDTRSYELHRPKQPKLRLTPVQFDLLYHLMSHPGQIFSTSRLLSEVWDYPSAAGSPDLVRVHIKKLRERIETDPSAPQFIRTVPGYGYMVSVDPM